MKLRSSRTLRERFSYRMPRLALSVASSSLKLLPNRLLRAGCSLAFDAMARQSPHAAMRALLEIESDLSVRIDHVALRYDEGVHVKHRLMKYHNFFVERLRAGERVLDLGCGYGAVAYSMSSCAGAIVTGVDINAKNIEMAERRFQHANLTFIIGDVVKDSAWGNFETIVLSNVLEHIEYRVEFLTGTQGRVNPERWLVRVPMFNRDWRGPLGQERGMSYCSDDTHFTEYTRESFEAEMQAARLAITHLQVNWGEIWAELRPRA